MVDYDDAVYSHGAVGGYGECAGALVPVRVQDAGAGGFSSAHLVTLSTCSYEFENARFVVVGVLTPIDPVAPPAGSGE